MTENTQESALAAIVSRLSTLSESELRQLYLVIGVRLGVPTGAGGGNASATSSAVGSKRSNGNDGPAKKPDRRAKRGNPQRKSQWANHPLYKEYSRLKKVVESQSKELKCSFNSVDTAESRAYHLAFIQWMEAKSSFRDRKTDTKDDDSDEESEEEGAAPVKPGSTTSAPAQPKAGPSTSAATQAKPGPANQSPSPPAGGKGKGRA